MAISRITQYGPAAIASGSLSITWSTVPAAGDTLVLNIIARAGQAMPASVTGWTPVFNDGTGAGFVSAQYTRTAIGTESGSLIVMEASTPSLAWIDQYHSDQGGNAVAVIAGSYGSDGSDSADGVSTTSNINLPTTAGSWIATGTVWSSSAPSFPTAPSGATSRSITQSGATFGPIQNRASTLWLTDHRYNLSDRAVTAGAAGSVTYTSNGTATSLRGLTNFAVLAEISAHTPPNSAATIPLEVSSGASYTTTDNSTVTSAGATITSRVWRLVSGGGSLSSTTDASITITAPAGPATQVVGITATDSYGVTGGETTYNVTISDILGADAGPDQTVDALETVTLQGSAGTSWAWNQQSGTLVTLSSLSNQNPTFTAPATVAGDSIVFGLKVSDGTSTSSEDTVTMTVLPHIEWVLASGEWGPAQIEML